MASCCGSILRLLSLDYFSSRLTARLYFLSQIYPPFVEPSTIVYLHMYMYIHPQTDPNSYHQVNCADEYPPIGLFTQICTHNHQDQRMNRKRDTYQKKFKLDFHAATQPTSMIIWHLIVICIEAHAKRRIPRYFRFHVIFLMFS